eukprot:scaffold1744_cov252-Pinguiococcus_pyrenoidosus.AAC.3
MESVHAIAATPCSEPRVVSYHDESAPEYDRPYLILDIRSREHFALGHILQARSFPASLLNQDRITPEIQRFRNKVVRLARSTIPLRKKPCAVTPASPQEGTLIILYDNDERMAVEAAKRFLQRGFENVFVLTGGIVRFAADGGDPYVEGDLPPEVMQRSSPQSRLQRRTPLKASPTGASTPGQSKLHNTPETDVAASERRQGRTPNWLPKAAAASSPTSTTGKLTPRKLHKHNAKEGRPPCAPAVPMLCFPCTRSQAFLNVFAAQSGRRGGGGLRIHRIIEDSQAYARSNVAGSAMDDNRSQATGLSVAESVISRSTARKGRHF